MLSRNCARNVVTLTRVSAARNVRKELSLYLAPTDGQYRQVLVVLTAARRKARQGAVEIPQAGGRELRLSGFSPIRDLDTLYYHTVRTFLCSDRRDAVGVIFRPQGN